MPELPEVQTIINQLRKNLPFEIKTAARSKYFSSMLHTKLPSSFKSDTITAIDRHGKWIIFRLASEHLLVSHLGMSGGWIINLPERNFPHTHLSLTSQSGIVWRYVDPRRFGHFYYFTASEWKRKQMSLGIDLLSEDFTLEYFASALGKYPDRAIKVYLLDQKFFPGVGNYIASEICAHAKIRPERLAKSLNVKEIKELFSAIHQVLTLALEKGGVTFGGGYQNTSGEKGEGKSNLLVFHQTTCQQCLKSQVKKIILAGRGTFFCPICQR
jgi:formamidopyrimidine-DNA glycosylase